jgi:hypothetical protein
MKKGKITLNILSLMSVQGSLWKSKAEIEADKNRLSQICLSKTGKCDILKKVVVLNND